MGKIKEETQVLYLNYYFILIFNYFVVVVLLKSIIGIIQYFVILFVFHPNSYIY